MSLAFFAAIIRAWSLAPHSHSRLLRKPRFDGNVSEFTVVSIWKIFTPASRSTRPMRFTESLIALWPSRGSMYDFECSIVCTLWWCLRLLYPARPTATDLWPPSIATRLMFTYTIRSLSAARLEISTSSSSSVMPICARPCGSSASKFFRCSG